MTLTQLGLFYSLSAPAHTSPHLTMTAQVAYCSDMDKSVIIANMEKRGWVAVGPEDEWQFYWASTQTCR